MVSGVKHEEMLGSALFVLLILVFFSRSRTAETLFGYENPEKNLLSNWDLEEDINGVDIYMACANGTRVPVSHTGRYSYLVEDRSKFFCSLRFKANSQQLKRNTNYYVSVFVKLANNPANQIYSTVTFIGTYKLVNSTKIRYLSIGQLRFERYNDQWQQVGGDFKTPDRPFQTFNFFLSVKPADVNYYIDTLSLIELGDMSNNWKEVYSAKIDNIRKETVTLKLNVGTNFIPGNTTVQIRQQSHHFRFGSALNAYHLLSNESAMYENYRNFVLKYFNWAGFRNAFKWKMMEIRGRGIFRFDAVDRGLDFLDANNMPVRAHTIVWDRMVNSPRWLSQYNGTSLLDEIYRRVDYVVGRYKNRVVQWDVNNEYLHQHDYELKTGELDLLCKLFTRARNIDHTAKLCTNDYELVRNGRQTSAAVNLARDLQRRGCGVGCLGVQSHLRQVPIDVEVLKKRLQILCSAGLPITITEFSVHTDNVTLRAQELEKAFYAYFSQDCVDGILLWGFTDQPTLIFSEDAVLTTGPDLVPNEAGQKMIDLMTNVWNTTIDISLDDAVSSHTFRAFHGSYKLIIDNGERILHETNFEVRKGVSTRLEISIGVC